MGDTLIRQLNEDVTLISFQGKLTLDQYEDTQMIFLELFDQKKYRLILDLNGVDSINISLYKIFSWAAEIILNNKGRFMLCSPNPEVYEKLDKIGLDELLEIVPDLDFAKELFEIV